MGYNNLISIEQCYIEIPKEDFPLKSDVIIGYEWPMLKYQDDECSFNTIDLDDFRVLINKEHNFGGVDTGSGWIYELEELAIKYGGTLIADVDDECEGVTEYIRVRNGVKKKVKIVEED